LAGTVYDEAIAFANQRLQLLPEKIADLEGAYRTRMDRVIYQTTRFLTEKVNAAIQEATAQGLHTQGGIEAIRKAFDDAGVTPANSYTVENLFRTETQLAYSAGRWRGLQEPESQEILWGFKYVTVGDDRVRAAHQAMDGITLPKDDPFWRTSFPPNGWSCRCQAIELFEPRTVVAPAPREIDGVMTNPVPDPGFDFNPGVLSGAI
jgi:SPP1 gp7 family putative phage head morphogenesis protein